MLADAESRTQEPRQVFLRRAHDPPAGLVVDIPSGENSFGKLVGPRPRCGRCSGTIRLKIHHWLRRTNAACLNQGPDRDYPYSYARPKNVYVYCFAVYVYGCGFVVLEHPWA